MDWLRKFTRPDGQRRWNDKTINRIVAHLKTFAKWVHKLAPFALGNLTTRLKSLPAGTGLEIERALTKSERRRLLDTADQLPLLGGRSRDRGRFKNKLRLRRKSYRPGRNRAIIYTFIETGMRRGALANLNLRDVKIEKRRLRVVEKGGHTHGYKISRQGLEAILDYLEKEREPDSERWKSPALFLAASNVAAGAGRLSARTISAVWDELCALAQIKGRTPHSARHAMGRHIIEKTGNVAAVQRQLGHKNAVYSLQYTRISDKALEEVLDER